MLEQLHDQEDVIASYIHEIKALEYHKKLINEQLDEQIEIKRNLILGIITTALPL